MKKVKCPERLCSYAYTYESDALAELRAESQVGIERVHGYSLLAVIEYPMRDHIARIHGALVLTKHSRERWWL